LNVRQTLSQLAGQFRTLTQDQIAAWNTTANSLSTTPEGGTSGKMTGLQLFVQQNAVLKMTGQAAVTAPLSKPAFAGLGSLALVITNAAGTVSIKFTATGTQPTYALVRACAPQSAGVSICNAFRLLGALPAAASGSIDITALYVAKFGAPAANTKLFIQVTEVQGGSESLPNQFEGLVPAAT
jgi:hypothetical protein